MTTVGAATLHIGMTRGQAGGFSLLAACRTEFFGNQVAWT